MKVAVFVVLALLFCLPQCALAGPAPESPASDMPAFSSTVDGISLPCIAAPISWNGAQFNRPDVLVSLMEQTIERPYVALGSTIQLTLDGPAPDSAVLTNYIINSEGYAKYSLDPSHSAETLTFTDGVASVVLKEDLLAMASSLMEDYLPGNTWRGFKLRCTWGDNECEYAFILRTDAAIGAAGLETSKGIDPEQIKSITIELQDGRTASIQMPPAMWAEYSVTQLFEMIELGEDGESVSIILD